MQANRTTRLVLNKLIVQTVERGFCTLEVMNGWLASGRGLTLNVIRPLIKNIRVGQSRVQYGNCV